MSVKASGSRQLRLAFFGDDFTGSTDALESLARAGARAVLFLSPPTPAEIEAAGPLDAVGVAGLTRALSPDAMEAELRPALAALRDLGASHVHYKVCSTFDSSPEIGSIGRAIEIGAEVFRSRFVPLLVGAPPLGRYCVFGNLFARFGIGSAGAIHRLDRHPAMSHHPVTPADESDLRLHLGRQTKKRIGLFDILSVEKAPKHGQAELEALVAEGAEIVLFDVLYPHQLARIGALIDACSRQQETPLFSAGSSGVEMALGAHWQAEKRLVPRDRWPGPGTAQPLLVVSGSRSAVTEKQIAWALAHGFDEVPLEVTELIESTLRLPGSASGSLAPDAGDLAAAIAAAAAHLRANRNVILHTGGGAVVEHGRVRREAGGAIGTALGRIVRAILGMVSVRRVVFAGGDTSSYAARALGIESVEMIAPLAPGAPLCRARAPGSPLDGLEVNFKGGQVGAEDYFGSVTRGTI